jgi:hypothetical protein
VGLHEAQVGSKDEGDRQADPADVVRERGEGGGRGVGSVTEELTEGVGRHVGGGSCRGRGSIRG